MSSKKTKKKISGVQTILKLNVGVFELRFSEQKLEIENDTKTWKHVYAQNSLPYYLLLNLAKQDKKESIEALCTGLYGTVQFFNDPEFLRKFMELLNESRNGKNAVEKND